MGVRPQSTTKQSLLECMQNRFWMLTAPQSSHIYHFLWSKIAKPKWYIYPHLFQSIMVRFLVLLKNPTHHRSKKSIAPSCQWFWKLASPSPRHAMDKQTKSVHSMLSWLLITLFFFFSTTRITKLKWYICPHLLQSNMVRFIVSLQKPTQHRSKKSIAPSCQSNSGSWPVLLRGMQWIKQTKSV